MRIAAFLEQSPMFAVHRAARCFEQAAARALAAEGLGFLEALVLAALFFDRQSAASPSRLAETFSTSRGNISHCVGSLEARGLISRAIDPDDARSYRISLKPAGRRVAPRVISVFERMQRGFEREAGKAALNEALQTIRHLEALVSSQ